MKRRDNIIFLISGLILLAGMGAADLLCGDAAADAEVIRLLRLPRTVTAILAGAALALAGTQMQSIFRNPLADPHIMGISAGASLGAAAATLTAGYASSALTVTIRGITIAGASSAGAAAAAMIILGASRKFKKASTLLIFGVMLGFIVNAAVSILQFNSNAESLKIFYSWSAGSFSTTTWTQIAITAAGLAIGTAAALMNRKGLDIILFGDEFAEMAGARPGSIRIMALLSGSILTGTVTAFCGPLGFVGIAAPHIARAFLRTSSHRVILPASLLTGSIIGLGADLLSQLSPYPIPTASSMAFIGIPVVLYILIKKTSL